MFNTFVFSQTAKELGASISLLLLIGIISGFVNLRIQIKEDLLDMLSNDILDVLLELFVLIVEDP